MFNFKNFRKEEQDEEEKAFMQKLHSGMRVEVLTLENRLIFVGTLQKIDRKTLQIFDESGQDVPRIEYNSKIKLRGFLKDLQTFALYGYICGSSSNFWRVDRLEPLQASEKREYYRQNTSLEAFVTCANKVFDPSRPSPPGGMQHVSCRILDISGGGALIRCKEAYQEGDWLLLTDVEPTPDDVFSFTCRVRRVKQEKNYFEYGCRFEGLTEKEQDRLMRMILVLQRKALQARRGTGDL